MLRRLIDFLTVKAAGIARLRGKAARRCGGATWSLSFYGGTESVGESWLKLHLTDKLAQQVRRWLVLQLTYSEIKLVLEFEEEQTKYLL